MMIEEKNILDQINFQIKRKGYDVDEVNVFIENLHNKYIEETLKVDNMSKIIENMEKVLRDNLEEDYDKDKSLLDIMLGIILSSKKQRYQLEDKQKRVNELEEKLGSLDNVQTRVMEILASAQEFRNQAELKAKAIVEKARQEAELLVEDVRRQAEHRSVEFSQKSRDVLEQTRREVKGLSIKMKEILKVYFNELDNISKVMEQMRAEYRRVLHLELEKLQGEWELGGMDNKISELKDSIRSLGDMIDSALGGVGEGPRERDVAEEED